MLTQLKDPVLMILLAALVIFIAVFVYLIVCRILESPFQYPYYYHYINVSGRKQPHITELIDEYLIEYHMDEIDKHKTEIELWKLECQKIIERSHLRRRREKQYNAAVDDENAYCFVLYRYKTKYRQVNYIKRSYQDTEREAQYGCSYDYLNNRNGMLKQIGYETSLRKYNSTQQRKLLTPRLRRQIIERDHYTCQKCGKYMPDEAGLEVDHIYPISKGGKTVPSNLQVLCFKCNRSKRDKIGELGNSYTGIHVNRL